MFLFFNNTIFSNTLNFEQDVYAAYSQYGKKINKFSYLLGLRAETTDRKIDLIQTNEIFDKKFTEFFPTVNLGLEFNSIALHTNYQTPSDFLDYYLILNLSFQKLNSVA